MKPLNTKTQFKEAKSYLKESLSYIYFAVLIMLVGAILGFVYRSQLTFIDDIIRKLILETAGMNGIEITFFILQNNLQTSLLAVLFGVFLGIFPIVSAFSNGAIIGYVLGLSYD